MSSTNILKSDPDLKDLLGQLDTIRTVKTFKRWKSSFLTRWHEFLEQANCDKAQGAYDDFSHSMAKFIQMLQEVDAFVTSGDLTTDRTTVKARNSLNEMSKVLTRTIGEKDDLIPQTASLERQRGYNKFHMGAVLVRDNFGEYGRLCEAKEILKHMRGESLNEVADKQILEEMDNFTVKLQKFCDVMADLGLFEVMLKCREFDIEEEGPDLESLIFIDIKTQGLGQLSREECLVQKVLSSRGQDKNGFEVFAEAASDEVAQEKLKKIITDHPTLGFGSGKSNNQYDQEEVGISDLAKVQSMWGVKLKKTPKNQKGQELIFIDQKNGAFGELSRKNVLENGLLTEVTTEKGTFELAEAENEFDDRTDLIERVRELLKLGIEKV